MPPSRTEPLAVVQAGSGGAAGPLAAAQALPGWRGARAILGAALVAGDDAVVLEARGQSVGVRLRSGDGWQPPGPCTTPDPGPAFAALKSLAAAGQEDPEFLVRLPKQPQRLCRLSTRTTAAGEQLLVVLGAAVPVPERLTVGERIRHMIGRLLPRFTRPRIAAAVGTDPLPQVTLEPAGPDAGVTLDQIAAAPGHAGACDLLATAVGGRAEAIVVEVGQRAATAALTVDGVAVALPPSDFATMRGVVAALLVAAGLDPRAAGSQTGRLVARVGGQPVACTVASRRGSSSLRLELGIERARPRIRSLTDTGMADGVAGKLGRILTLERGLVLVSAPARGGLSTLFDAVLTAADRLLRDFVAVEDAASPRAEIQNVKPYRWDSPTGEKPVVALDAALRDYPDVLAACDLDDAELATRLLALAGEGKLVIVGVRAADAADAITRLVALTGDPRAVGRALLGAVGSQLLRKLCPHCRQEYLPAVESLARLRLDPEQTVTLFRAAPAGCPACTGTGHLGRTAACELAAGATLQAAVTRAADAQTLRQAAVKDGMLPLLHDAVAKAAQGVTSVEEVQRVFRRS